MFNIARHISNFLASIQDDTQKRFIKQAKKRHETMESPKVVRLTKIEKEIEELKKILKDL